MTVKSIDEIYEEMTTAFHERSGVSVQGNSDLAIRMYAAASQIEAMYIYADWVKRQMFPQTADGGNIDLHAEMRGLSRKQASRASGSVTFMATAPAEESIPIPVGTICVAAGNLRFVTTEDGEIPPGETQEEVPALAEEPGSCGNIPAGAITGMVLAPDRVEFCFNGRKFDGGLDAEADEELRARVLDSYRKLPNGANAAFYESEMMEIPEVAAVSVIGRARGIGTVDVVISTLSGMPDGTLIAKAKELLENKREIAVDVSVLAPEEAGVHVEALIQVEQGADPEETLAAAGEAVRSYFSGKLLAKPVYRARLGEVLMSVSGVSNYEIVSPTVDIPAASNALPTLQGLAVSEMRGV